MAPLRHCATRLSLEISTPVSPAFYNTWWFFSLLSKHIAYDRIQANDNVVEKTQQSDLLKKWRSRKD